MFDHIGLRVRDLDKSARLYAAMLAPLGHVPGARDETYAGFGPKDAPALWLHRDRNGGGGHVALRARDRGNGATYYAAFLIDLDGNNIEAVCSS
jgi:catechol 2,3-dioxygenase-like lactoylglutathione lyase family enzyme